MEDCARRYGGLGAEQFRWSVLGVLPVPRHFIFILVHPILPFDYIRCKGVAFQILVSLMLKLLTIPQRTTGNSI